jgi:hypothetical protein
MFSLLIESIVLLLVAVFDFVFTFNFIMFLTKRNKKIEVIIKDTSSRSQLTSSWFSSFRTSMVLPAISNYFEQASVCDFLDYFNVINGIVNENRKQNKGKTC